MKGKNLNWRGEETCSTRRGGGENNETAKLKERLVTVLRDRQAHTSELIGILVPTCLLLTNPVLCHFFWLFILFDDCSKVPFFTMPPEDGDGGGAEGAKAAEAMFVKGFGKEFDVDAVDAEVGFPPPCYA